MNQVNKKRSLTSKLFEFIIIKSWWVLILLICFVAYDIGIKKRNKAIFEMKCKYSKLVEEKQLVLEKKEDLDLRLQSQSDPTWIEMVLMKELGVVPENKIKVHFKK